jgi:hypothetical protein
LYRYDVCNKKKMSSWFRFAIHIYIQLLSWLPLSLYTIFPFFIDMSTSKGYYVKNYVYGIHNVMIILFSIYFTILFYNILKKLREESNPARDETETIIKANAIVRSVTYKSIIHCVVICSIHLISFVDSHMV